MKKILAFLLTVSLILAPLNAYAQTEALQSQTVEQKIAQEPVTVQDTSNVAPNGQLDVVSATQIAGWAWRSDLPNTPLDVNLYIRKTTESTSRIISLTANSYRPDLESAGIGNGYHSFSYPVNWLTEVPGEYKIAAIAIGGNGVNVDLGNSPKYFTVRESTGTVDSFNGGDVAGWAWKPDAPNKSIQVHIYFRRMSDWSVVDIYTLDADRHRLDLENAGYGYGFHGFSCTIDWSSLPEEQLAVELYAVDGSGHNPRFYLGYKDNRKPIYLLGETDEDGVDFSYWMTSTVRDHCYDIGCSDLNKWVGFNNNAAMSAIANSSFCVIDTHGSEKSFECNYQGDFTYVTTELLEDDTTRDYSTTRCVLLLACENGLGGKIIKTTLPTHCGARVFGLWWDLKRLLVLLKRITKQE